MIYCLVPDSVDPMLVWDLSGICFCDLWFLRQLLGCGIFHVLSSPDQQGSRAVHSQGCPAFLVRNSCWGTGVGRSNTFLKCHRPPLFLVLGILEKCCSFVLSFFVSFRVVKWLLVTFLSCQCFYSKNFSNYFLSSSRSWSGSILNPQSGSFDQDPKVFLLR